MIHRVSRAQTGQGEAIKEARRLVLDHAVTAPPAFELSEVECGSTATNPTPNLITSVGKNPTISVF